MRRLAAIGAFAVMASLGFGSAFVYASSEGTPETGAIPICHSGNGKNFTAQSPDASGVLNGHAGHDADIIPPFTAVDQAGTTTNYPGKNMDAIYGDGATGAEVLANGCEVPVGVPTTDTTATITLQTPETLPGTVTAPPVTETLPATTTETVVTQTVTVPPQTVTAPGATTTVAVPSGQTTTVTAPANTVTLPAATVTVPGETITHPAQTVTVNGTTSTQPAQTVTVGGSAVTQPAQTVTVPGTTQTVTAAGTATVLTVTAPSTRFVRGGVLAAKIHLALKQHRRLVRVRSHVLHVALRHVRRQKLIVIVLRPRGCPAGTSLFSGRCAPIVHGRG